MKSRTAVLAILIAIGAGASGCSKRDDAKGNLALHTLGAPSLDTCVKISHCEDGINALSQMEKDQLAELMSQIKPETTEAQISARYTLVPDSKTPPIPMAGFAPNTYLTKVQWYVRNQKDSPNKVQNLFDSHIDVFFINDKILKFEWWTDSLEKVVHVTFMG